MGTGIDRHCRWVRRRLPLLSGGELAVDEQRRVERHLIGCRVCQAERDGVAHSHDVLQAFRLASRPVESEPASLWPALATQIRRSRHVQPAPNWWESLVPRGWAVAGLALGLIGLVASTWSLAPRRLSPRPSAAVAPLRNFSNTVAAETPAHGALPPDLPLQARESANQGVRAGYDPTQPLQFSYDLDHGTPMGPGNRDPQKSY